MTDSKLPVIAFCTTCKGRAQHLEQTLPRNIDDNDNYPHLKFIILDYASQDHLVDYLRASYMSLMYSNRVTLYRYREPGQFRMAHAKNLAHRLGILEGADILVNLDADNYTEKGFAAYVAEQFKADHVFLFGYMIKGVLPRGITGRIAVSSKAFISAGGYDERYNDWSPDDKDFNFRLQRLGYTPLSINPKYLSGVRHNDRMRFKEYPHAQLDASEYESERVQESDTTIVNFGRVGCGTVYRNFEPTPIDVRPIPTRIFGIGLHKTGTTSLHTALQILGFDSAHWLSAHWAKAVWVEMTAFGKSLTLEKHYASMDLPIPLFYRELDKAYPGSKFILTVRDEASWVKSIKSHWDYSKNQFRAAWDTDAFTHQVHTQLYGRKKFDEQIFLARYRAHNVAVKEYFRNRPEDLLVVDLDVGASWPELCKFLDRPAPAVPYPKIYETMEKRT